MVEETEKVKAKFLYAFPGTASNKVFQRNGWKCIQHMDVLFKPLSLMKILKLFSFEKNENLKFYDKVNGQLDDYNFKIEPSKIQIRKTGEYLKWRTSNPNYVYRLVCSYDLNGQVNGYLIYSFNETNLINIIDMDSHNSSVSRQLVKGVERMATNEKYRGILVLSAKGTAFYRFIKNQKYLRNPFNKGSLAFHVGFQYFFK